MIRTSDMVLFQYMDQERNETSTNVQQHHQHHHQQHHHHEPPLMTVTSSCASAIAIDTTTTTTTALIATTSSLTSSNSFNATIPLAASEALQTNLNKRLVVSKRRSYRNHNMRTSVVTQVARSVRKRRPPAKLAVKQEQIDLTNNPANATYDISNALVNVDRMAVTYPYNCMNCGRKYQTVSTLKRHMRSECNQPKKFVCRLCNRGFHHNFKLSDHLRRLHNIK